MPREKATGVVLCSNESINQSKFQQDRTGSDRTGPRMDAWMHGCMDACMHELLIPILFGLHCSNAKTGEQQNTQTNYVLLEINWLMDWWINWWMDWLMDWQKWNETKHKSIMFPKSCFRRGTARHSKIIVYSYGSCAAGSALGTHILIEQYLFIWCASRKTAERRPRRMYEWNKKLAPSSYCRYRPFARRCY